MGQLNQRIYAAMNTPAVAEQMKFGGFVLPKAETPKELAAKLAKEVTDVRAAAAQFGIQPQ